MISHIAMSFELGTKSLIYSKKWLIYVILSLAPFVFSILNSNRLGAGNSTALQAFIGFAMTFQFGLFYEFGVLLLALPFSSDEITDHIMDLFLIKPVRKEIVYFTRYVVLVLASTIINGLLVIFYYIYYFLVARQDMFNNLGLLINVIFFFLLANILYSALYLGIGILGSKGFGIGVFVAILETFLLNLFFLSNDPSMPRTNLQIIANNLFGSNFSYTTQNRSIPYFASLTNAYLYIAVITIIFLAIGFYYFKSRDYN